MNDFKEEVDNALQKLADGLNDVLNAELDKIRSGEDVPYEGSVRKAYGFYITGHDENPNLGGGK